MVVSIVTSAGQIAVRIERPIADRDDDMANRSGGRDRRQVRARAVLVDGTAVLQTRLVGAEGCGQESRLFQQLRRAAIRFSRRFELAGEQPIEVVNGAAKPAQMIVQREHLRDERRTDVKRRR